MSEFDALEQFSIVVVPFPYADQLAEKKRPALVISKPAFQVQTGLVWVAMITSAKNAAWPDDILVSDFATAGLPAPSVIRPVKIATIDAGRILARLGSLDQKQCLDIARFYTQSFS